FSALLFSFNIHLFFLHSSLSTFVSFYIRLFLHSSRNAVRVTLSCKYALTYHSSARSGKLNFQVAAFRASQRPLMSRRDAAGAVRSPAFRRNGLASLNGSAVDASA